MKTKTIKTHDLKSLEQRLAGKPTKSSDKLSTAQGFTSA